MEEENRLRFIDQKNLTLIIDIPTNTTTKKIVNLNSVKSNPLRVRNELSAEPKSPPP